MQYERSITSGLEVMAKVKVFVHAADADPDADGRAMTLAPQTYLSRLAKKCLKLPNSLYYFRYFTKQELRELFTLDNPRHSKTQVQLEEMHSGQRNTDSSLDAHIAYLYSLGR